MATVVVREQEQEALEEMLYDIAHALEDDLPNDGRLKQRWECETFTLHLYVQSHLHALSSDRAPADLPLPDELADSYVRLLRKYVDIYMANADAASRETQRNTEQLCERVEAVAARVERPNRS